MSDIKIDLPDITVAIIPDHEYITSVTPSEIYQVDVNVGDIYNVNVQQPDIIVVNGSSSVYELAQIAGYAFQAGTASLAVNALTASYATNPLLPTGTISSSYQVALNQLSGSVFSASNFTFPQNLTVGGVLFADQIFISSSILYESGSTKFGDSLNDTHQFTGSILVSGSIAAPSITGSFKGDGSQLTGLVTDLRISGSTGSDTVQLLTDTLSILGERGVTTDVSNNQIIISIPTGSVSSSQQILNYNIFATTGSNTFIGNQTITGSVDVEGGIWVTPGVVNNLTSSYSIKSENIGIIDAGLYQTGSVAPISPISGISHVTSASYATTASYAVRTNPTASYALTASYAMNAASGGGGGLTSSLLTVDTYYFVGDGLTTNYVLANQYSNDSLIVTVGGVTFISPNDFTISGTDINFFEPPYSGSNIFVKGFVNVTNNVTGSFSGSLIGTATTASYVKDLFLSTVAPIVPKTGSVYFSGSFLYVYDGIQYKSASLS